jgi:hypothetical protein
MAYHVPINFLGIIWDIYGIYDMVSVGIFSAAKKEMLINANGELNGSKRRAVLV